MLHTMQDLLVVHLCLKIHPEERQVSAVMSGGDKVSLCTGWRLRWWQPGRPC